MTNVLIKNNFVSLNRLFIMSESGPKGQTTHIFLLFESEAKKINHQYGISCIALKEIHEGCNNLHQARTNII